MTESKENEAPTPPPNSPAQELFAEHLQALEVDEQVDLETLIRAHPEHAAELERIHQHWEQVTGVIDALDTGRSFYERLRRRYGKDADPGFSLDERPQPGPESRPDSSPTKTLARLEARLPSESPYESVSEIARGGMGAILKVWDRDLRRTLAMKVMLKRGEARSDGEGDSTARDERLLGRFLEEAQVTAQLDHPGIVPVHELGLDGEGRVFFTMPLIKGQDLAELLDLVAEEKEGWTKTRVLGVILKVCEAMAYAHSKKVIHRDLKPGNVMAGRFGEVYVMDWGLARVLGRRDSRDLRIRDQADIARSIVRTDRRDVSESGSDSPLVTMDGDIVGTPSYMSPEQARGDLDAMGPASDVYSIGCILYHLLVGHMPYVPKDSKLNAYAVWGMLQNGPPTCLREIAPDTPEELAAICDKAMEREIEDRYQDTVEMAGDLRAYLEGRVVKAHRTGPVIEFRKWVQRNKALAATEAAALFLALAGVAYLTWFQAQHNRRLESTNTALAQANKELLDKEKELFVKDTDIGLLELQLEEKLKQAEAAENDAIQEQQRASELASELEDQQRELMWAQGEIDDAIAEARQQAYAANMTAAALNLEVDNFPEFLRRLEQCPEPLRGWEWRHLRLFESASLSAFDPDPVGTLTAAFTPDGSLVVRSRIDGDVDVLDAGTGERLHRLAAHREAPRALAISDDGRLLATGSPDRTIRIWDLERGIQVAKLEASENEVRALVFTPGGRQVVAGDGWKPVEQLNVANFVMPEHSPIRVWDVASGELVRTLEGHSQPIRALALHPDGRHLLSASQDRTLALWDLESGDQLATYRGHASAVTTVAFLPGGEQFVSGSLDRSLVLWDLETGQRRRAFRDLAAAVNAVAISPDGKRIASVGEDASVQLWDASSGAQVSSLRGHEGRVTSVAFGGDGDRLLTAGEADGLRLWDSYASSPVTVLRESDHRVRKLPLSYDDVRAGAPSPVWLVELEGQPPRLVSDVARLSLDGTVLVHRGRRRKLRGEYTVDVWDARTSELRHSLKGHSDSITALAVNSDGTRIATGSQDRTVRLWDARSGAHLGTLEDQRSAVVCLAFSPSGDRLASGARDGRVMIHYLSSGRVVAARARHSGRVFSLAWDPTGAYVASGGSDDTIRIWTALDGYEDQVLQGHNGDVIALSYAPDSSRLFSGSRDQTIRVWDLGTGQSLLRLAGPGRSMTRIHLGPHGRLIATAVDRRPSVHVWDSELEQARAMWRVRETARAARSLVTRLCADCETPQEVLSAIEADHSLTPDVRALATTFARALEH